MKHLASISGGKDSTATLAMAIATEGAENVEGAFADTGNEHEAVYDYVRYLEQATGIHIQWLKRDFTDWWWSKRKFIAEKWPLPHKGWPSGVPQVVVDRALAVFDKGPTGNPYLDLCIIKGRFPSRRAQFCTQYLKTEPLTEYAMDLIELHGAVWSWQGIRLDESHSRRSKLQGTGACVKSFEVVGGGLFINRPILRWTAADVFEAHRMVGLKPNPLYSMGANRVGCMPCINAGKDEVLNISKRFPQHIDRIEEWELVCGGASKRGNATFFPAPGESATAFERGNVREVIKWSKTQRGGRMVDWIRLLEEPAGCSSSFGLCESAVEVAT
jgi:3'-phosphoadenosine 5'-phosphosulfate sulfotransferase (PAPS reductase)/FAD synthetase